MRRNIKRIWQQSNKKKKSMILYKEGRRIKKRYLEANRNFAVNIAHKRVFPSSIMLLRSLWICSRLKPKHLDPVKSHMKFTILIVLIKRKTKKPFNLCTFFIIWLYLHYLFKKNPSN